MLIFTLISRQTDNLALAADTGSPSSSAPVDLEKHKQTAKNLLKKLSGPAAASCPPQLTIESASFNFHILAEQNVFFLVLTEKSYPSSVAFAYLDDVSREFIAMHGGVVATAQRPYQCIRFDSYLQKTKKVFAGAGSSRVMMSHKSNKGTPVKRTFKDMMGVGEVQAESSSSRYTTNPGTPVRMAGIGPQSSGGDAKAVLAGGSIIAVALLLLALIFLRPLLMGGE